ncbi:hypothetical protein TNCV_2307641 [Trichonephila clavipes]|nr:hypothetical protein TNCV_2307641 [Trichonephila clavipes]
MPLKRRKAQYHQLMTGELDHILELHKLGLSLRSIAIRVGHNVSTIPHSIIRWIQEGLCACQRGSDAHRCTARDIQNRLLPGVGESAST